MHNSMISTNYWSFYVPIYFNIIIKIFSKYVFYLRDMIRYGASRKTQSDQEIKSMSEQLTEIIVNEVVQIYLPSTNIKRTVEWYKNVFGFQVIWEQESAANLKLKHGPFLFIKKTSIKQPVQFEADEEVSPVVSFQTSDLNLLHEKLKSEKYQVGEINQHGEGINGSYKDFYITDPDGNLIEVSSYPDLNLEQFRGY